jgi:hypothetical protein
MTRFSPSSLRVLEDLSSGPKRLFYMTEYLFGWKALERAGLVIRYDGQWAKLTDKGIELMEKQNIGEGHTKEKGIVFTKEDALKVGKNLDINWDKIDLEEFIIGMNVELEHGTQDEKTNITDDDPIKTAEITLAHINEEPHYYTNPMPKNWGKKEAEKRAKEKKDSKKLSEIIDVNNENELFLKAEEIYTEKFPPTFRWTRGYFNIPGLDETYLLLAAEVNFDEFGDDIRDFHVVDVESGLEITNQLDDEAIRFLKKELLLNMDR